MSDQPYTVSAGAAQRTRRSLINQSTLYFNRPISIQGHDRRKSACVPPHLHRTKHHTSEYHDWGIISPGFWRYQNRSNMTVRRTLVLLLTGALSTLANPLSAVVRQTQDLSPASIFAGLNISSLVYASTSDAELTTGNAFDVECNGNAYGSNLPLSDCQIAHNQIAPDSTQQTFGDRHDIRLPPGTFPLPYMTMGGK